jgi:hypothetical protein
LFLFCVVGVSLLVCRLRAVVLFLSGCGCGGKAIAKVKNEAMGADKKKGVFSQILGKKKAAAIPHGRQRQKTNH